MVPDILEDPLLTRPPMLDTGGVLPGDSVPPVCPAHFDPAQPLELANAVDTALCDDPRVTAAWAAIKVQAASVGMARAAYLPMLTGSLTGQRNETRYPSMQGYDSTVKGYSSYAALNWRLFDFGERAANRVAANDMLAAALASYNAQLQKTLGSTAQAYFDAMTAQAAYEARVQAAQFAQWTLESARRRELRGATGRSDTLQAATALARAQLVAQRARGDADRAMAILVYTTGLPAGTHITLPQDTPRPVKQDIADLAQWLSVARLRHPAIIAAQEQLAAAREKITSVRSQGLPTIDFGVGFYQNGYPNQNVQPTRSNTATIGVTLTIPLFEGFARTYKVREAQAQAEQGEAEMRDTEREILSEVVKAHADTVSSRDNLDAAAQLVVSAESALASSRNRYEHGAADILEMLNAQSALADAQLERIRSESDWRSARLRLMAGPGMLGRHEIVDTHASATVENGSADPGPK
ncbi:TolC family protein [Burkholderia sp. Ac-20365]|nr:TolC family protein [Burkholderia sp. Ac-20365]